MANYLLNKIRPSVGVNMGTENLGLCLEWDDILKPQNSFNSDNMEIKVSPDPKKFFHIITFELISERLTSKSSHEAIENSVRLDVIGTFWRA